MYRLGQGTKKDYSEAIRWYQTLGIRRVAGVEGCRFDPGFIWVSCGYITVIRVR